MAVHFRMFFVVLLILLCSCSQAERRNSNTSPGSRHYIDLELAEIHSIVIDIYPLLHDVDLRRTYDPDELRAVVNGKRFHFHDLRNLTFDEATIKTLLIHNNLMPLSTKSINYLRALAKERNLNLFLQRSSGRAIYNPEILHLRSAPIYHMTLSSGGKKRAAGQEINPTPDPSFDKDIPESSDP